MSLLTLQPSTMIPGRESAPLDLGAALAAGNLGSNTGIVFPNTGHEIVVVQVGSTATTVTSDIGSTVEGETVPGVPSGSLATGLHVFPPFPADYDKGDGSGDVELDFSSSTGVSVAVLRVSGA